MVIYLFKTKSLLSLTFANINSKSPSGDFFVSYLLFIFAVRYRFNGI